MWVVCCATRWCLTQQLQGVKLQQCSCNRAASGESGPLACSFSATTLQEVHRAADRVAWPPDHEPPALSAVSAAHARLAYSEWDCVTTGGPGVRGAQEARQAAQAPPVRQCCPGRCPAAAEGPHLCQPHQGAHPPSQACLHSAPWPPPPVAIHTHVFRGCLPGGCVVHSLSRGTLPHVETSSTTNSCAMIVLRGVLAATWA